MLLVGFGNPAPKELWIAENLEKTGCRLGFGVGALFDFTSRAMPRARPNGSVGAARSGVYRLSVWSRDVSGAAISSETRLWSIRLLNEGTSGDAGDKSRRPVGRCEWTTKQIWLSWTLAPPPARTHREHNPRADRRYCISPATSPDPVRNRTTPAVKNFIDLLDDCDHVIVSIKRYSRKSDCYRREFDMGPGRRVIALGYQALPAGLFHRRAMARITAEISNIVSELRAAPDLVVAHKLTIEGVIAYQLRQKLGLPYICCVRGEVEDKFFRYKPELKALFGEVIAQSEALFYVSAWFKDRIEKTYPGLPRRQELLPNFSNLPIVKSCAPPRDGHVFVTALDLDMYRRKGFHDLPRGARGSAKARAGSAA